LQAANIPQDGTARAQDAQSKTQNLEELTDATADQAVCTSHLKDIKISAFWRARPKLWFVSLESEFAAYKVRSDETMYRVTVRHLDEHVMLAVADVLEQPPTTGKYEMLKRTLIERFSDSLEKQMRTLLSELELGDKKPSVLLREMRTLAGSNISDSLLRTLWLQRLPARIQEVLVVLDGVSLDKLAMCADKATECAGSTIMAAAENSNQDGLQQIKQQISELTQVVAKLSARQSRSGTKERKKFPRRERSKSAERKKICYYHRKFGEKAWQCLQPCESEFPLAKQEN